MDVKNHPDVCPGLCEGRVNPFACALRGLRKPWAHLRIEPFADCWSGPACHGHEMAAGSRGRGACALLGRILPRPHLPRGQPVFSGIPVGLYLLL
eukprot:7685235-Pyramimonas_sp.AAC.1